MGLRVYECSHPEYNDGAPHSIKAANPLFAAERFVEDMPRYFWFQESLDIFVKYRESVFEVTVYIDIDVIFHAQCEEVEDWK